MFKDIKKQLKERFEFVQKQGATLFYVSIDRDKIWETYLEGFTEEDRQGNNCNCCKSFLRQFGGIVGIDNQNKRFSLWDFVAVDKEYEQSIKNIAKYIKSLPITDVFYSDTIQAGTEKNFDTKRSVEWNHFALSLPSKCVIAKSTIDTVKGRARDAKAVFKRGLDELKIDATEALLELIAQGSLYRGNEFKGLLDTFLKMQKEYASIPAELKDNYAWRISAISGGAISSLRNSVIGTLITDLSEGVELDKAVASYERKVAPSNYKRPAAIVTPKMVEEAKKTIEELGYADALERRYATSTDLDINNVLFVDKSSEITNVFEEMKKDVSVNPKAFSKIEEVPVEKFISEILPKAKSIEVLLENNHLNNMVSLITSDEKKSLFTWNNPFSWSYTGGITDSIKERVKAAGGNVDGFIRISLSWSNYDDLDLHLKQPSGGSHVYYGAKKCLKTYAHLDVDENGGAPKTRTPVENIAFPDSSRMIDGTYEVIVNQYAKRETTNTGFTVQIEHDGVTYEWEEKLNPKTGESVPIVKFEYTRKNGFKIGKSGKESAPVTKEKWNLKTNQFHRVKNLMLSPNHWEKATGNKHYIMTLEDCISDEEPRPFFNEFLNKELVEKNKRVFEVLGGKIRVPKSSNQLSGLGFSDTQRNHVIVRVGGTITRNIKVTF